MPLLDQVVILARLQQGRSEDGSFAPSQLTDLFDDLTLPRPAKVSNQLTSLEKRGWALRPRNTRGAWRLTPEGRAAAAESLSDIDVTALLAETAHSRRPSLGSVLQTEIPQWMAPPDLIKPVAAFVERYPFETNVFGMTRFPSADSAMPPDPLMPALELAREVCKQHGLTFHLASDAAFADDLWANVQTYMWGSKFGIAFFENTADRGLVPNLTIEVGSMITLGRRIALIKDGSIASMPTDLVGKIYKSVDLQHVETVGAEIHAWVAADLGLGRCSGCKTTG